jgi:hypothetical protein
MGSPTRLPEWCVSGAVRVWVGVVRRRTRTWDRTRLGWMRPAMAAWRRCGPRLGGGGTTHLPWPRWVWRVAVAQRRRDDTPRARSRRASRCRHRYVSGYAYGSPSGHVHADRVGTAIANPVGRRWVCGLMCRMRTRDRRPRLRAGAVRPGVRLVAAHRSRPLPSLYAACAEPTRSSPNEPDTSYRILNTPGVAVRQSAIAMPATPRRRRVRPPCGAPRSASRRTRA